MTLLVAGGNRVDAGKTVFSTGLVARTGAVGFKPRAGNDFWFDHDDYRDAVDQGRLFGKDARKLAAAAPGEREPEDINPVHRLWRPAPRSGAGLLGQDGREFLVDRVSDRYVVNDTVSLPAFVRESLPLDEAERVETLAAFNNLMADLHVPAQDGVLEAVERTDRAVVESYADVARPVQDIDPDAVAVVEPGRVRVYDGRRYQKGCAVAGGGPGTGQLEERVADVLDLIEPKATLSLSPLSGEERGDPEVVADAYAEAYDRLVATALE